MLGITWQQMENGVHALVVPEDSIYDVNELKRHVIIYKCDILLRIDHGNNVNDEDILLETI